MRLHAKSAHEPSSSSPTVTFLGPSPHADAAPAFGVHGSFHPRRLPPCKSLPPCNSLAPSSSQRNNHSKQFTHVSLFPSPSYCPSLRCPSLRAGSPCLQTIKTAGEQAVPLYNSFYKNRLPLCDDPCDDHPIPPEQSKQCRKSKRHRHRRHRHRESCKKAPLAFCYHAYRACLSVNPFCHAAYASKSSACTHGPAATVATLQPKPPSVGSVMEAYDTTAGRAGQGGMRTRCRGCV